MSITDPTVYDSSAMRCYMMEEGFTSSLLHGKITTIGLGHFMIDILRAMWQKKELCDYTIHVGAQEFHVHKVVLAAFSDYFRRMFSVSLKESRQDFVELKGVTAAGVEPIINLLYKGEELKVTEENIVDVLRAASFLHMPIVMHLCVERIEAMIDVDNCIDILNLIFMYSLQGPDIALDEKALKCLQANWKEIINDGHIVRLCHDAFDYVLSNTMVGISDYDLFKAIEKWVNHHMPEGTATKTERDRLFEMLKMIHFPLMSEEELEKILETCSFIMLDARCCQLVAEAQLYKAAPIHQRILNDSPRTTIRNDDVIFAFCGNVIDKNKEIPTEEISHECFAFVEKSGHWLQLPHSELTICHAGVTVVNNFLIVCGGYGNKSSVGDECYVFDPRFMKWNQLASMNCIRQSFSLVHCSGSLYAIGGICNDSIERYDFDSNQWSLYDHMDTMLWDHSAVEYDGTIYVSGGMEGFNDPSSRLRQYDPDTKTWEEKAPMLFAAHEHTMIVRINYYQEGGSDVDKYLFVFNSTGDDMSHWGSVTRYNPDTNQWMLYNLWVMPGKSQIVTMQDKVYYLNGQAKASRLFCCLQDEEIDDDGIVSRVCVCLEGTIESTRYQTQKRLASFPNRFLDKPICCKLSFPVDYLASSSTITFNVT